MAVNSTISCHDGYLLLIKYFIRSGAAHGLSSILQMLLYFPSFYKSDPNIEQELRASVDFMISIMQPNGNIAPAMDEVTGHHKRSESDELVHWCHGGPGL